MLLCVFVAGVLVGIWVQRSRPQPRIITYKVEPNQQANLMVSKGDRIQLADGTGKGRNWMVSFLGDSPCVGATIPASPVTSCEIGPNPGSTPYAFACTDGNDSGCPDPGIQPSPSTPLDLQGSQETQGTTTDSTYQAYVYCDPNAKKITVFGPGGKPVTDIPATSGLTVNWTGHNPFTLKTTQDPGSFCSKNPDVTKQIYAQCSVIATQPNTQYKYTLQTDVCQDPTPETLTTPPPAPVPTPKKGATKRP